MAEFTKYEPGTPSWVDLGSPDLEASKRFYGELFGWKAETSDDPQAGGYTLFTLRGKQVAGLGPLFDEGQPPAWSTYVTVDDLEQTVRTAEENGGKTAMAPMDVMDVGRMAILFDPAGAAVSLWQPAKHIGSEIANEPGAFCWNELLTRDIQASKTFYGAVFGWGVEDSDMGGGTYTMWKTGDKAIAGGMQMDEKFPPDLPSHWLVYFGTADVDEAVAKVEQLGGRKITDVTEIPGMGRFANVADPHGAVFALFESK